MNVTNSSTNASIQTIAAETLAVPSTPTTPLPGRTKVAIKFLLPETLGNAEVVARFAREARAAVKIKSEHVARVSDVGRLETGAPHILSK